MSYILAFRDEPVPAIPEPPVEGGAQPAGGGRMPDHREHFGTREAALRRAAELLPAPAWRRLRLYGPDGARIADQDGLQAELAGAGSGQPRPPDDV